MLTKTLAATLCLSLVSCASIRNANLPSKYDLVDNLSDKVQQSTPKELNGLELVGYTKIPYSKNNYAVNYLNTKPIEVKSDGGLILETVLVLNEASKTRWNKDYLSEKRRVYLNCKKHTFTDMVSSYYSTKDATGTAIEAEDKSKVYIPTDINIGTIGYEIFNKVCPISN